MLMSRNTCGASEPMHTIVFLDFLSSTNKGLKVFTNKVRNRTRKKQVREVHILFFFHSKDENKFLLALLYLSFQGLLLSTQLSSNKQSIKHR